MDAEMTTLVTYLDQQREHVLGAVVGLSADELRRPVLPSGWSCLSLVQHLALDVEHYWFRCILTGESLEFFTGPEGAPEKGHDGWKLEAGVSAEDIVTLYRDEIIRANELIAAATPGTPPRQHDPHWGDWSLPDARSVLLHVIAETACHAGHLDAARELLDGRQWLVL